MRKRKDTIQPKVCYWIGSNREIKEKFGENAKALMDGQTLVMVCKLRTLEDFEDERKGNECFELCEIFTTQKGNRYYYWRDNETDEDYITKFESVQGGA